MRPAMLIEAAREMQLAVGPRFIAWSVSEPGSVTRHPFEIRGRSTDDHGRELTSDNAIEQAELDRAHLVGGPPAWHAEIHDMRLRLQLPGKQRCQGIAIIDALREGERIAEEKVGRTAVDRARRDAGARPID